MITQVVWRAGKLFLDFSSVRIPRPSMKGATVGFHEQFELSGCPFVLFAKLLYFLCSEGFTVFFSIVLHIVVARMPQS